jgi:hypothetical protein
MTTQNSNLIHGFNSSSRTDRNATFPMPVAAGIIIAAIAVGTLVGFGATALVNSAPATSETTNTPGKAAVGISDKKTFKDKAEGVLREGGIEGEGNFHLERPGGPSKNVYLTSTAVDLSEFIGKKVRVHGETFSSQKAGWLMDVGYVEML